MPNKILRRGFGGTPRARVGALLTRRGPSAVVRAVAAVVIRPPINRVFGGGAGAEIDQKIFETSAPSLTYGNPSPAVEVPVWVLVVRASLNHVGPNLVFRGAAFSTRSRWKFPFTFHKRIVQLFAL